MAPDIIGVEEEISAVTHLVIHDVDEATQQRLRERAARHGRSVDAELREILKRVLQDEAELQASPRPKKKLGSAIREIFEPLGGVDLPDVRDRTPHKPISFD